MWWMAEQEEAVNSAGFGQNTEDWFESNSESEIDKLLPGSILNRLNLCLD